MRKWPPLPSSFVWNFSENAPIVDAMSFPWRFSMSCITRLISNVAWYLFSYYLFKKRQSLHKHWHSYLGLDGFSHTTMNFSLWIRVKVLNTIAYFCLCSNQLTQNSFKEIVYLRHCVGRNRDFSMYYLTVTPSPFFLSFESFFFVVFLMNVSSPPFDCSSSYLATNSASFFFALDK